MIKIIEYGDLTFDGPYVYREAILEHDNIELSAVLTFEAVYGSDNIIYHGTNIILSSGLEIPANEGLIDQDQINNEKRYLNNILFS